MKRPALRVVLFDWGDTLMRDFGLPGPMASWERVEAVDGAPEVVARLAARYRLGIATNTEESDEPLVFSALARVGLREHISFVASSRDIGARKPEAAFFAGALARAGCAAEAVVMVGDSLVNDVGGARAAGIKTVWLDRLGAGLPGGEPRPDAVVHSLREVPAAIERLDAGTADDVNERPADDPQRRRSASGEG